jgi:hypothetical protein
MTVQYGTTLRNNQLDQLEVTTGTSAKLQLRSGAQPANCAAVDTGTLLCEITLPSDWMNAAATGQKTLLGTWQGTGVGGGGTIAHFRLKDSTGTTCHMQGSVGIGTGDLQLDNTVIADGQTVTITAFTVTAGNA